MDFEWNIEEIVEKFIETKEGNEEIEKFIQVLKDNLAKFDPNFHIFTMGSYRLQVHTRGSGDIDLCIVGSDKYTSSKLFPLFKDILSKNENFSNFRIVDDALIPVLKVQIKKQKVDILYSGIPDEYLKNKKDVRKLSDLISNEKVSKLSSESIQSLNGIRDAEYIETIIPDMKTFILCSHFIKYWANRRGLYSSSLGFLNGFTWRELLIIVLMENSKYSPQEIIFKFFQKYNNYEVFDVKKPLALNEKSIANFKNTKNNRILIITPNEAYKNAARNVTKSTFKYMVQEIDRAYKILKNGKNPDDIKVLNQKTDFFKAYDSYIQVDIFGGNKSELRDWQAYIESRLVMFLESLEKVPNMIAIPFSFPIVKNLQCTYYISISFKDNQKSEFTFILFDFINLMNKWEKKTEETYILIKQLKRDELKITF